MRKNHNSKIIVYNNTKVVIENYDNIIDLNNDLIKIDIYELYGLNLKVKQIDSYYIIIEGLLTQILIVDDTKWNIL